MNDALPPHILESERYVIGACFMDPRGMLEVGDLLDPEHFYDLNHQRYWKAMKAIHDTGAFPDILTTFAKRQEIEGRLSGIEAYAMSDLLAKAPGNTNTEYHAMLILQTWMQRKHIEITAASSRKAGDMTADVFDLQDQLTGEIEKVSARIRGRNTKTYAEAEAQALKDADKEARKPTTTGFRELDQVIGGWMPGDLVVIAARPAMGKSAFAFSSSSGTADAGHGVGMIGLELSEEQTLARYLGIRAGVPVTAAMRGEMNEAHLQARHVNLGASEKLPLFIRAGNGSAALGALRSEIKRLARRGVKVVFIDQLNWIEAPATVNRNETVGNITRALKQTAKQEGVTIALLHQLSREVEKRGGDKIPILSDLRDSGNVEQDAQVVLFLYRAEYYGITEDAHGSTLGVASVIVAKNTNGPTGTARLRFNGELAAFQSLDTYQSYAHAPF